MTDKLNIYLVDDHAILREGIRAVLMRDPALSVIGEASDGETALNQLSRRQQQSKPLPDVVLLDIGLPGMNGIEVARMIKKKFPDIKVLILSMHENQEYVRMALQVGADGYVLKRTAGKELTAAIHAVASGHTLLHPDLSQALLEAQSGKPRNESSTTSTPPIEGQEKESTPSSPSPDEVLTAREIEVLRLIASGYTNAKIGEELHISIKTVQAHRANLMQKLGYRDALELTKYALRHKLIELD